MNALILLATLAMIDKPSTLPLSQSDITDPKGLCRVPDLQPPVEEGLWLQADFSKVIQSNPFEGCRAHYNKDYCPRTVYKIGPQDYRIICYNTKDEPTK